MAKQAVESFFSCDSQSAYKKAMEILQERYGHPFVVQQAFRNKLEKWPKISAKDPFELCNFSDFLNTCEHAMSSVPSLKILNDCFENQKIT